MKIGNPADKAAGAAPATTARTHGGENTKAKGTGAATGPDESTKVELSKAASSLLSAGASSDFDSDKVARISHAISDGKFQINADKIADRLIANAHEVLGKAQH